MKNYLTLFILFTVTAAAPVAKPIGNVKRTNFEIDTILDVNRNPEKSSYATTEKRTNFEIDTILDVNRNPEKSSYAAPEKRTNFEIDTILDVNRNPEKSSYAVNV